MLFLISIFGFLYATFYVATIPVILSQLNGELHPGGPFGFPVHSGIPGAGLFGPVFGQPIPYTIAMTALFIMSTVCLVLTHCSNPGYVPGDWPWDPTKPAVGKGVLAANALGVERKMDGRHRFCRYCGKFKPDRSHHCRRCGQCVLEMDHHCPWVKNCIGFHNHKLFFLLLLYGVLTCWTFAGMMLPRLVGAVTRVYSPLDIIVVFAWFLAIALGLVLTLFWLFHLWLACKGYTTIEFCEKRHASDSKRFEDTNIKVKLVYSRSLFDRGCCNNFMHLVGSNPLLWLLPTRLGMPQDGTIFKVRDDASSLGIAGLQRALAEKNQALCQDREKSRRAAQRARNNRQLPPADLESAPGT